MSHVPRPTVLSEIPDLAKSLRQLLAQVPPGRATTCGALAAALGNRVASVWVGHYLLHHKHAPACPCHRVVRSGGVLGGYAGGDLAAKRRRLVAEGVPLLDDRADLDTCEFRNFHGDRPLERLAAVQAALAAQVRPEPWPRQPQRVAGVDVAYLSNDVAQAAYALVEVASGELVWSTTVRVPVRFPYIRSFLTFRELPALLAVLDAAAAAGPLAPLVFVDGTGMLHPRRAGIASHLGVAADLPTIGVTKKLLCGEVDTADLPLRTPRTVWLDGEAAGAAIRPTATSARPIYVSPGHRVDCRTSVELTLALLAGRRLPAPIYWADRLSRQRL